MNKNKNKNKPAVLHINYLILPPQIFFYCQIKDNFRFCNAALKLCGYRTHLKLVFHQ